MNFKTDILTSVVMALLAAGFSACGTADSPDSITTTPAANAPTFGITLALSTPTPTRATGNDQFELGTGLENYLDIANDDYRIYFFDTDNKYISTFRPFVKPSMNPTLDAINGVDTYSYTFLGNAPTNLGANFKLVVLANWKEYPAEIGKNDSHASSPGAFQLVEGETTIEDLVTNVKARFYAFDNDDWLTESSLIPFYGVRAYDLKTIGMGEMVDEDGKIKPESYIDLRTSNLALPIIRAMARIDVILTNPLASFKTVRLTKINPEGFSAPHSSDSDWKFDYTDYFHEYNWDVDFTRHLHLPGGKNTDAERSYSLRKVTKDGVIPEKWMGYISEYDNSGDDFTEIAVTLQADDKGEERTIQFTKDGKAPAAGEKRYNIERNNIYRVFVSGLFANLTVQVDIQPYTEVVLTPDYGLARDDRGDLMILPDKNGNYPQYFLDFKQKYPGKMPKDENDPAKDIELVTGDYYCIVMNSSGEMKDADIWVKDSEGYRVLTNYAKSGNTDDCTARKVIQFFGLEEIVFFKDLQGERRLHHYDNHWSIVYDSRGVMILKSPGSGNSISSNAERYEVESWDEKTPSDCWIVGAKEYSADGKTVTTTFILYKDAVKTTTTQKITTNVSTGETVS